MGGKPFFPDLSPPSLYLNSFNGSAPTFPPLV
uniref:Uncharacterized protein n=1 Tax=Anguilla anguilla TaxID=7936 RepID=A0A0E9W1J0_ANGAN